MADFVNAFERALANEGGYKLTNIQGDAGGQTYAGISRNKNPSWSGWEYIDRKETPPSSLVRDFYEAGWWNPLRCSDMNNQDVAESVYDFAINTSGYGAPKLAAKLAQLVAGATPDGVIGDKSIGLINGMDPRLFLALFALAKIARYRDIVAKDKSQMKFFLGWVNRSLKGVS